MLFIELKHDGWEIEYEGWDGECSGVISDWRITVTFNGKFYRRIVRPAMLDG